MWVELHPSKRTVAINTAKLRFDCVMLLMVIIMFLPVIAIPVFWWLPLGEAIPAYVACLLLSGSMHWVMHASMKLPAKTGTESFVGREIKVISSSTAHGVTHYLVRIEGEIWNSTSADSLAAGETVVVEAVEGNKLVVRRKAERELEVVR